MTPRGRFIAVLLTILAVLGILLAAWRELPGGTRKNPGIVCITLLDPVCGVDGRTYGNRCEAERQAGVAVAHEGPCRAAPEAPAPPTPLF